MEMMELMKIMRVYEEVAAKDVIVNHKLCVVSSGGNWAKGLAVQ